jgi:predicted DNA-binding ribbon-helix-helix protein
LSPENDKKSILESRNVTVGNKRTSMRLEPQMWESLEKIARTEGVTINSLCTQIDLRRGGVGLTSATRVFIISYYRHLVRQHELERGLSGPGIAPRIAGLKGASLARWVLDTVVPAEALGREGRQRG